MANKKPLYDLYKGLRADNYDVPDNYESFERTLTQAGKAGADSRHTLYEALKKNDYDVPEKYENFYSTLFEPVNGTTSRAKGSYGSAPVQKPAQPTQPAQAQQSAPASSEDWRQKGMSQLNQIVAHTNAGVEAAKEKLNNLTQYGVGLNNGETREGGYQINPRTNAPEKTYLTPQGNRYSNKATADMESQEYRRAVLDAKFDASVDGQLKKAYEERDRLDEAMKKRMKEIDERPGQKFADFMREAAVGMTPAAGPAGELEARTSKYDNDEEFMQLMAAARKNSATIQLLEDKKNNKTNDFWHTLGTTAMNGYTFSDGMSEMRDATALANASKYIDSINKKRAEGKELTKEEQTAETVLKNFALNDEFQSMYGGQYGAWSRAGGMMAHSLDFMKDIGLFGGANKLAKELAKGTAKGIAKGIAKATGKEAAKIWKNNAARRVLKATGVLVGAHATGAAISNTTSIGHTGAAMAENMSGNVTVDKNGKYEIEDTQGFLPAFLQAERQQARENGSEMFGVFMPGLGSLAKKELEKIGLSKISGAITKIGNKEWYKQYSRLMEAGGYNGLPGEALEEYEGSLFDALTGHAGEAWDDMTNMQNHVDIWLGCATMGALLGGVPMVIQGHHTAQYYRYKHNTDKADKVASFRLTQERWEPLRDEIDGTDNSQMAAKVMDIINDQSLHVEEKKAALDYVRNLTKMRGYSLAEANNANDTEQNPDVQESEEQYQQGRDVFDNMEQGDEASQAEAKAKADEIAQKVTEAKEACEQAFGTEADARMAEMANDPWAMVNNPELSEYQQDAVLNYIKAKSAQDGLRDASNESADNKRQEVENTVQMRTSKDTGMIQPATLKVQNDDGTDKTVYVVKGNVATFDDGTIDARNSDQSIVIFDTSINDYRITSPDFLYSMGEGVDPQSEIDTAVAAIQAEHDAMLGGNAQQGEESVQNSGESVQKPAEGAPVAETIGTIGSMGGEEAPKETALSRVPVDEKTQEPMFEQTDSETALDAISELTGGNEENTEAIINAQVEQANKAVEALKKKQPKRTAPKLTGSPMAMIKAQQEADASYNAAMEQYNAQLEAAEGKAKAWTNIWSAQTNRKQAALAQQEAERKAQDAKAHEEAVAQLAEDKRKAQEKAAEQEAVGVHAVNPKIKEKWDNAKKVDGNANAITLADGSSLRGHYVLTEAGAASASHDAGNGFEPTDGFPIDKNGESVNDRDYRRDKDAQRIVQDIADNYDSRALQTPVVVSKDGVVLSGNNRTMSGEIAARQGTDKAYVDYLKEFGKMYGFTPEQIEGMEHPRILFVPDEDMPYDASTFARFNAETQKKQSKPEMAVKLGKTVPDKTFTSIASTIGRYDRLSDFYADQKAVNDVLGELHSAGVINEMQLPELRTGNTVSAVGRELIENTLIGKVFQTSPDAVRQIIATPTLRQSIMMALNEIAHNRTLAKSGYDLGKELGAAVDLVARAKAEEPDVYKEGVPVSPYGRQQGLFDEELGESRITDVVTLLLADVLNSNKPSDLRKFIASYNADAMSAAAGQLDMFSGDVRSKEQILNDINNYFQNATPRELQERVDAAIAERKRNAEGGRGETVEQGADSDEGKEGNLLNRFDGGAQTERHPADVSVTTSPESLQGNISVETSEPTNSRTDVDSNLKGMSDDIATRQSSDVSEGKVNDNTPEVQEKSEKSSENSGVTPLSEKIKEASADVNTEPTEAQKEAGNYKKGHVQVGKKQPVEEISVPHSELGRSDKRYLLEDGEHAYKLAVSEVSVLHALTHSYKDELFERFKERYHDAVGDFIFKQHEPYLKDFFDYFEQKTDKRVATEAVNERGTRGEKDADVAEAWTKAKEKNPDALIMTRIGDHYYMYGEDAQSVAKLLDIKCDKHENPKLGHVASFPLRALDTALPKVIRAGHRVAITDFERQEQKIKRPAPKVEEKSYSIKPATYTNKKGKQSDVSLLKFKDELTKEQERAVNEFAREKLGDGRFAKTRGWKDRDSGGWMFRSEEDAKKAAEMVGNAEAVEDAQPLTAQELRDAVETTKPAERKKPATKKAANKVEIAETEETGAVDSMGESERKGLQITDEMKADEDVLRDLLGISDDEVGGTMFRDPDSLTPAERRKVFAVGVNYALGYIDQGFVSFPDFAKAMTSRLGYKIKPWLKSFYEGAKRIPGYEDMQFTSTEEVDNFDVENFDNPQKSSIFAKAEEVAAESKAKAVADKADTELKGIRNEQRKEHDKQAEADTAALASEAETVASEAETVAKTSRDRRTVSEASERVDETLDKTSDRLALLGYYEADEVAKDYNEATGYMRNAEKKAVRDAANLAESLIADLGLSKDDATHSTDKNGKRKAKPLAVANIAPVGGDITMHLPLTDGRNLYINIQMEPVAEKGVSDFDGNNLEVTGIMWRVESPNAQDRSRYGSNQWEAKNVTYQDLLKKVQRAVYKYIPQRSDAVAGEYKVGDKVQYTPNGREWYDGVVANPDDQGGVLVDTGHAPVMWVHATKDQLRHKNAPQTNVNTAIKEAKDAMTAKLEQIKDKLDAKLLSDQIAQRDKFIDELGERVKNGERVGTFAGTKNVDLQGTLLKCMGEREALEKALDNLPTKQSPKQNAENIADNPQSWIGKTFTHDGTKLVCKEIDRGRVLFENKSLFMDMAFDVDTVQGWLKSGKMKMEDEKPVEAVGPMGTRGSLGEATKENIFQKAERIAKAEQTKREVKVTPVQKKGRTDEELIEEVLKGNGRNWAKFYNEANNKADTKEAYKWYRALGDVIRNTFGGDAERANEWAKEVFFPYIDSDAFREGKYPTKPKAVSVAEEQKSKTSTPKKKVKPEQKVGDLFAGSLFDKLEYNGLERNHDAVRTEGLPSDSSRNSRGGSVESNSKVASQGSGRTDGSRKGEGRGTRGEVSQSDRRPDGRVQGLGEHKNARNNHSERGVDHAPTSVNARIDANIKAIELAHKLLESGETATPEQMDVLRQFSGWGGLGAAFNNYSTDWKVRERSQRIYNLLGKEAYDEAVMSANSAYYTPAYVVDTLWDIARQLGFKGGNILEGSAGIGNILGQMPMDMSDRSDIHAIEIDGTSGGILSLLYPDAKVDIQGFEQTRIPNGSVDLAITNVPFVTGLRVSDTTGDSDLSKKFHNIHDFCIAKNVRKLREGGLGIFISSNGTLDNSKELRDWVVNEGNSDFIGAFRMNNKTFGGTTVTSDIIVIRKRVNGQKSPNAIDVADISGERTAEYQEQGGRKKKQLSMDYNKYFIEHPDHMAGEMRFAFEEGDTFRPTSKGLYPVNGKDQNKMLQEFVETLSAEETGGSANETETTTPNVYEELGKDVKEGSMVVDSDGNICIAQYGKAVPLMSEPSKADKTKGNVSDEELRKRFQDKKIKGHTKAECFKDYTAIKTALADVMKYQTENEDNAGLQPLIDKLNKAYDSFVEKYGHFNKNNQLAWLRNDVDYSNVFSIEDFKEVGDGKGGVTQTFGKADVMKHRVVEKENEPHPENVKDGVVVSMFKNGRIDVPYIAAQLGKSEADVKREIIESGLGFEDPATRQMEVSYKYLSGNVREKLRQAEANNENGEYAVNIKALQDVVPMSIPAHLIDFTLGSSWLSPKLYEEYVKDRTDIDVKFTAVGGSWYMEEPYYVGKEKNRAMGVVSEMLGKTIYGHEIIEAAIQNKTITVSQTKKHYDGTTETITDREATAACASKVDEIRQDFKDWMRQKMQSDAELSVRMETEYNDRFNNYVPMRIPDEFVPEFFGGATHKFKMRPHQGKAIVRGTMQPLLLAHEVGTGKTFTLISTAMEMRRLGTARKPMIVVQNATVGQFVASAKELYPNAKILTLEDSDRNAEGRKNFYAKIKYNDWDMIVVPQSTFERIPDSEERQMAFIKDKISEKEAVLEKMKEADSSGRNPVTRQAERELESLQAEMSALSNEISAKRSANDEKKRAVARQNAAVKAQEMLDRKVDDVEDFDDMGIDALLVDEAHEYKHLGFATAMQRGVKGVDPSYSKKSQGVYLKTQAVLQKSKGRNVVFATGTPISNTAAEIWTFMRYLMPADTMKEYDIYYFDDFVRNFGNIQQMPEFNASGKFKEVNRFAGYVNLPELVRIWSGVADTVLTKDQAELVEKIPEMDGGKAQDIYLPQTRALRSVMKYVKMELKRFEEMSGKEKKENSHIPLTMYTIAQSAAVDARLVLPEAQDEPNSKTNEAVRQTLRSLKETDGYKGTVAIFADHYKNNRSGFNLFEDIKKKLVEQGVPEKEIAIMKPGMTIKTKVDIFDKVNHGEVRVVLGSTATLGTGVNIQERLHTLIHLDAPNRPMDYTQRNGRILRQGNLHKEWNKPVRVLRFGVEDSLDVTAYQRLKTKGAIADSVMEGDKLMSDSMNNRVLEEEEDVFGDTVAQLSGSEYALLKNNAEKNVRKYESRKRQWEADQTYIHNAKPKLEGQIKAAERRAEDAESHLQAVKKSFPDGKTGEITIGNKKFGSVEAMADFIKDYNKKITGETKTMKENPADEKRKHSLTLSMGGFNFVVNTELSREVTNSGAGLFTEVHRDMTYSCPELGLMDVPVKQSLLRNAVEDIAENVITGKDFEEQHDNALRSAEHGRSELEQLKSREGKPFEFSKELEEAQRQLEEYTEAMKQELEEKEKKYAEMDASVEAATDVAVDEEDTEEVEKYREGDEDLEYVNERFNDELQKQIDGTLPEGHIYQMGMPGEILRSTGVPYLPIQMSAKKLQEKATMFGHDFDLSEVRDLVKALQKPLAVFTYGDKEKGQNIIVPLQKDGKNFLVGLSLNPIVGGRNLEINSIRNVFPKDNAEWLNWINQGKNLYLDKERIQTLIDQQRTSLADVEYLDLDSIAKVLEKPENSKGLGRNLQQAMVERVNELSERLHTPVRIVRTGEEVAQLPTVRQRKMKGSFNPKTGEVTIVVPNNANLADIENTFVHEVVGHDGLRVLFPEEETFNNAMDELYRVSADGIKQTIDQNAKKMYDAEVDRLREKKRKEHEAKGEDPSASYYADMAEAHVEASKKKDKFRRDATEEYGADLAGRIGEEGFERMSAEEQTFWGKVKAILQKALQRLLEGLKISGHVKFGDKEWAFVLHEAYKRKKNGGRPSIFDVADTVAMRHKTGFGESTVDARGEARDNDVLFRDGDDKEYEKAMARDTYERRVVRGMYQTQEALQDSMLGLKEAMEAVMKAEGNYTGMIEDVAGYENAYLGENRLSSVNQAEMSEFARTLWKPLLAEVSKLAKTADQRAELTDYMMAKHGLERNDVMARRDAAKKADALFGADIRKAEYAVNKDPLDQDAADALDDLRQRRDDKEEELYLSNRGRDYAGLTALTKTDNVVDAEAEAQKMVGSYEMSHDTTELWSKTTAVTDATLAKSYASGMIDRDTYNDIKGMYQNYIPLRGFDEKTSDEVYAYLNDRKSAFSSPIKTAKGRKSKADDPFANMEAMAESAIMQGNRNVLVKQRFLNFVLAHPSDLVSVSDLWLRYDDVVDEWKPLHTGDIAGTEKLAADDSPAEVERKMQDFEAAMEQLSKSDPVHFVKQKERPDIPYRVIDTSEEHEHQVIVKRNGKDYVLTINGSPRAAQALNGLTNPDNDATGALGRILHVGEVVNRQLSAFYTTRNPDFIASNFMRDAMYANTMTWIKESPGYAWHYNRNFAKVNPVKMKMLFARLRNGELDMNDETDKLFYQFMMNGGETGYTNLRDIDKRKNDIKRELKKNNGQLPIGKACDLLGERFDEYNRAVENCARFAAFVTSRQMGRSVDRAIWDAKEISVNFNKKGSGAKFIDAQGQTRVGQAAAFVSGLGRSGYVFWNAALQGTFNFGKAVSRNPKKALTGAAMMFLLGAINAALNGDDDDDTKNSYYNLPEYVRRSNIVFRMPGMKESWISIPLSVEYRAIYGMGELAASALSGKEHMTDGELANAIAGQVSQMLPIDMLEGGGGWMPFVPSAVKPVAEIISNKSWTGMPIYKSNEWNKDDPEWTKAFKNANGQLVGASKWLNEVTGGDQYTSGMIDINPSVVEYLLTGYFGGVANTANRMVKMGETVVGEREYDPKSFLILNRLVKSGDERTEARALNNEYYRLRDEHGKISKRLKRYEADTDDGVFDYADKISELNNSPEYRRMEIFEEYGPDIDAIKKELDDVTLSDAERKELEQERVALMRELVDAVDESRKEQ